LVLELAINEPARLAKSQEVFLAALQVSFDEETRVEENERSQGLLASLEDLLVREFRVLQAIVKLSKEERVALSTSDGVKLLPLVEEKEALLDELGQLEENRKMVSHSLSKNVVGIASSPSVSEIVRHLEPKAAERLGRLGEGISTLVIQSRDLNQGNHALAAARVDWLDATQAYLLTLVHPPTGYSLPGKAPSVEWTASYDVDHRA